MQHFLSQLAVTAEELGVPKVTADGATATKLVGAAFLVIGMIAVLIIIIGAIQYVTSQGDPSSTAKAKNTIMYAAIGAVISMSSYGILTFVIGNIK